jgi:hypothetical protein
MGKVLGRVLTEKGRGIESLLVTACAVTGNVGESEGRRQRLAAVITGPDGSFRLEHILGSGAESGSAARWDLLVTVETRIDKSDGTGARRNLLASETREDASALETFRFVLSDSRLQAAGVALPPEQQPEDLIARDRAVREVHKKFAAEKFRRLGDSLRQAQALREGHVESFNTFLERLSIRSPRRGNGYIHERADIVQENLRVMRRMITQDLPRATAVNHAVFGESTLKELKAKFGPELDRVPATAIEAIAWPWKTGNPGITIAKFPWRNLCGGPPPDECVRLLEGGSAQTPDANPNSTPPAISNIRVTDVIATVARISWTTQQPAGSQVEYGTTTNYGSSTALDTSQVTTHSEVLSNLNPATMYHYLIRSADTNGSVATSEDLTFMTAALPTVEALVHAQEDTATSAEMMPVALRSRLSDVQGNVDSFLLRSGPADAPALFDFHHLRIAFEPVWQELFDTSLCHKAHQLYSQFAEAGVDPNSYLDGPLASMISVGSFPKFLGSIVKDAQTSNGIPIHHWVTQAFEITQDEWAILQPDEQRDLTIAAARVLGAGKELSQQEIGVDASFGKDAYGFDTLWEPPSPMFLFQDTESMRQLQHELLGRCRRIGERIISNARARLTEPNDFDKFHDLLKDLHASMKEPYRFNVYAANGSARSVNFGIVVTYRQRWEPVAYQVGELVKTIPLAPKESRKFNKKTVVRHSRAEKEVNNSLESRRTESSDTWRAESQIVSKATTKTNFQLGAQGGVNLGIGNVSGSTALSHDTAAESEEVKQEFREAVFKATEEYKQERTLTVETNESVETTVEETGEISNPNDEIPVTYLFYQLQRRYRINEEIRSVAPVVLVAQEFPRPGDIDEDWIVAHDWILRRVLLDDSFVPALNYLATKVVGDEVALQELYKNLQQQRRILEDLKDEVIAVKEQVGTRYRALEKEMERYADAIQAKDEDGGIIPMPVGFLPAGSDVSTDAARQRTEAARDAAERAAKELKDLQARLDRETTSLSALTDAYTKQLSEHLNRKAQIDRLRVHIKENIFYYMQAIWSHEPHDQRFFRLHDVPVPRLVGQKTYTIEPDPDGFSLDGTTPQKLTMHSSLTADPENLQLDMLGEMADLDNLLGFKGNFMIFPMRAGNDLTDFMMMPYYDQVAQLVDPDPLGNWTLHDFVEYVCCLKTTLSRDAFMRRLPMLTKMYARLKQLAVADDEIVVPSDSLYIEALPGVRPVLEDFKLLHRALDVKKVQAEVRAAELENVRMAARLFAGEREDPTIEKKVVVENASTTIVGSDV